MDVSNLSGSLCAYSQLSIGADTILQSTFSWTGPGGFTSTDRNLHFDPVYNSDSGMYILTGDILGGCLTTIDTFNIEIDSLTNAEAENISRACFTDSILIELEGNAFMTGEKGYWTLLSSPAGATYSFYDDSVAVTTFKTDVTGTYSFRYTVEGANGCLTFDDILISVVCLQNQISGTVFGDFNEDQIHDGDEFGTSGIWVFLYADIDDDGIVDIEDASPIDSVQTNSSGYYLFDVFYNDSTESYFISTDTNSYPTGSYLTTDNDEYAQFTSGGNLDPNNDFGHSECSFTSGIASVDSGCQNEDVLFIVSPAVSGATYAWSFESGTPSTSSTASQLVSWASSGTYDIELVVSDASCEDTFTTDIVISSAVVASAAPNDTVCRGGEVVLDATSSSSSGVSYTWAVQSGDPFSIDANGNSTTPSVSPYVNTVYKLTVVDTATGCNSVAFVNVNVDVSLNPTASLSGPSGVIPNGVQVFLDGSASAEPTGNPGNGLNYEWLKNDVPMSAWNYDTMSTVNQDTNEYSIIVIDAVNGCADTATTNIVPLPVELLSLTARVINTKDVEVSWTTASELNNDYFTIERRYDYEQEFEEVGTTPGNGTTNQEHNYTHVDNTNNWLSPVVYYRIKQTDYNGEYSYSYVVAVSKTSELELLVYPNPAQTETTVAVLGDEEVTSVRVLDIIGKDVTSDLTVEGSDGVYTINLEGLRNGTYIVEITTKSQRVTERIQVAR